MYDKLSCQSFTWQGIWRYDVPHAQRNIKTENQVQVAAVWQQLPILVLLGYLKTKSIV